MRAESACRDTLRSFCARLKELRYITGPTIASLDGNPRVPLQKSQIIATLQGQVTRPPKQEFVQAFIEECTASARRRQLAIADDIDLKRWLADHEKVVAVCARQDSVQDEGHAIAWRGGGRRGRVLTVQRILECAVRSPSGDADRRLGVVTGDIRQVRDADIWVNSENTEMEMARIHDFSVSGIIRYEGARRNGQGRVMEDLIADDLARVRGPLPLEPGAVVRTGAGELRRYGVRHIVHAATVHGEPGAGWRPMKEIGRCVTNVLTLAETLDGDAFTVLFPMLGVGTGGGELSRIARELIHAACNYLRGAEVTRVRRVLFLAYTDLELRACDTAFRKAGLKLPNRSASSAPR